MRTTPPALLLALALTACGSTPQAPATAPGAVGADTPAADDTPLTGSRFARKSSDRSLRVIGAEPARTDMSGVRSIGNTVGARGN